MESMGVEYGEIWGSGFVDVSPKGEPDGKEHGNNMETGFI